jgi:glycosyltransferase involved in cell wall biosynthesis
MADKVNTRLLSFGDQADELTFGSLNVRIIGSPHYVRGQRSNPIAIDLFREVLRASVVHCHQQHVVASSLAALTCRAARRKVFVSDLGGGGWDISSYVSSDPWYHGHLHISQYSRHIYGQDGRPRARVIYGGVDTAKFSPGPPVARERKVVFVGRIMPHKGIDDLVRALPEDIPLEIIGAPYDDKYLADLHQLANGRVVHFRHDCNDEEIIAAYRSAMCVVLPSVYKNCYGGTTKVPELLGQTLLEGMACGTPAICTDVASMPEVVRDGETGFIVPPNDSSALREKIQFLSDHPVEVERMGAAARERVLKDFTWPQVVNRCLESYSEL